MSDKKQTLLLIALIIIGLFGPPLNESDYLQGLADWAPSFLIIFLLTEIAVCLFKLGEQNNED